jgi:hypothetical protein
MLGHSRLTKLGLMNPYLLDIGVDEPTPEDI